MRAFRIKDRFYGWFCHPEGGFCPKDLGFEKSRTKNRSSPCGDATRSSPKPLLRMTDKGNSEADSSGG